MASNKEIPATGTGHITPPEPLAPPLDAITKLELFLEKHWRSVVAGLALLVAVVVVYFYLKYKGEHEMTASNQAFSTAGTRSDYEAVVKDHPGTVAAGSALYAIADRQIKASEWDGAASSLQKFLTDFPDHPLHYDAMVGLGGISQNRGDYDKALEYFQKVIDAGDKSAKAGLAGIFKGETLVAKGDLEKAKEHYEAFGAKHIGSPFVEKAIERLAAVEKRIALAAAPKAPVEPEDPKPEIKPEPPVPPAPTPGAVDAPAPTPAAAAAAAAEDAATPPAADAVTPPVGDAPAPPAETPEPAAGGSETE